MEDIKICEKCGCVIIDGEEHEFDGVIMCEDCYCDNVYICDECGDEMWIEDGYYDEHNECSYCPSCYWDTHTRCANCGDIVHNDNIHESVDGYICDYCADYYYRTCEDCGALVHEDNIYYNDDDVALCSDCYDSHTKFIRPYDYKPDPVFYGDDSPLYMGVELEIDGAGENSDNAKQILDVDPLEHIYCKHDGSLNEGFEIVSHPCTLEYHKTRLPWENITTQALDMGYTSHDAKTCGLHVHVSRNALGYDEIEQEKTIANILYFTERYWYKLLAFSRRTPEQLNRWASRYGHEGKPLEILEKSKKEYARYRAINLLPRSTVEFRLFRGTLKTSTFYATLELVYYICNYAKERSNDSIITKDWNDFVNFIREDYAPELVQYLKEKNIYMEV